MDQRHPIFFSSREQRRQDRGATILQSGLDLQKARAANSFYQFQANFSRQQKTVRNVFHFANMLLYRGYLLQEILQRPPPTSPQNIAQAQQPSEASHKCVYSALKIAQFAGEISEDKSYNAVYWVRHEILLTDSKWHRMS